MRIGLLEMKGDAFEPEEEGVPVNQPNRLEGDEGVFDREGEEIGGCEFHAAAGEGGDEGFFEALVVVDPDGEAVAGNLETKVEFQVEFRER
jgi:hypothetical protein